MNEPIPAKAPPAPTRKFECKPLPNAWLILLMIVPLLLACATQFSNRNPVVRLPAILLFILFSLLAVAVLIKGFKTLGQKRVIEIRANGAQLEFLGGLKFVRYGEILRMHMEVVTDPTGNFPALIIKTDAGESRLRAASLKNPKQFDELSALLMERWRAWMDPGSPVPKMAASQTQAVAATAIPSRPKSLSASGLPVPEPAVGAARSPIAGALEEKLLQQIQEKSSSDPLIGAKVVSRELVRLVMMTMKDGRGVHIESLLCAMGAMAGYACQAGIRAQAVAAGKPPNVYFQIVEMKSGLHFYFGDTLNGPLAQDRLSIWSLAAGVVSQQGVKALPKLQDMFSRVAKQVGEESFGRVDFPEGHNASDLPINYVKHLYPKFAPLVERLTGNPKHWSVAWGLAIQEVLKQSKGALDPALALNIVMQSAIPMSKVELSEY